MTRAELELLKYTLETAQATNTGEGLWLPEKYQDDLNRSISIVKRELKAHPEPRQPAKPVVVYDEFDDDIPF